MGVDEMVVFGKPTPFGVTDRISPASHLGKVIIFRGTQYVFEVRLCVVGYKVACQVCRRDVAET